MGARASTDPTFHSISRSVSLTPAAIGGERRPARESRPEIVCERRYPYVAHSFHIKSSCVIGFPVMGSHMGGICGNRSSK